MNGPIAPFAAVLLAGGRSQRMGRDKALLPLADGCLLWERQLAILRALEPSELFLSGPRRPEFPANLTCLPDEGPPRGPLGGIAAALGKMTPELLVVLAVDLPEMTTDFLRGLLVRASAGRGVVPRHPATGLYEPLAAVYPAKCLTLARERLRGEDWSLQGFVRAAGESLQPHEVATAERPLFANWNEPARPTTFFVCPPRTAANKSLSS